MSEGFVDNEAAAQAALRELNAIVESPDGVVGLRTGLPDLDRLLGGMRGGDLILIGAETSKGKSALGMQIAEHVVAQGHAAAVFSLEMSERAIMLRRICAEAGISLDSLRYARGAELDRAWRQISIALRSVTERKLWIDPSPVTTVPQMQARSRRKQVSEGST